MQAQGDDRGHFPGAGLVTAITFDPVLHGPFLANGVCERDQVQNEDEEIHANVCGRGDALGGAEHYAQCNDAPDGREDALQMTDLAALFAIPTSRQRDRRSTHRYEEAPAKIYIWPWPGRLVLDGDDTDACHCKCCEDNGEETQDDIQPPCWLVVVKLIDPVRGQGEACHIERSYRQVTLASRSSISEEEEEAKGRNGLQREI